MTRVSVVIPAYNAAAFLPEAIASVYAQTVPPDEIIVVDDGSTDNSRELLAHYDRRLHVVSSANGGPAGARNLGIRAATGAYIAFLDADDIWQPAKLELQLAFFDYHPACGLVYTQMTNFSDETGLRALPFPDPARQGRVFDALLMESFILLSSVVIPRRVLDRVGLFDEGLRTAEDTHLFLRIAKEYAIGAVARSLVRRRLHDGNISERHDIPVGTLDCLDKIVALYPETAPGSCPAMRSAYRIRGGGLAGDFFHAGRYDEARRTVGRLLRLGCADLALCRLWVVSLLPAAALTFLRFWLRKWRRRFWP